MIIWVFAESFLVRRVFQGTGGGCATIFRRWNGRWQSGWLGRWQQLNWSCLWWSSHWSPFPGSWEAAAPLETYPHEPCWSLLSGGRESISQKSSVSLICTLLKMRLLPRVWHCFRSVLHIAYNQFFLDFTSTEYRSIELVNASTAWMHEELYLMDNLSDPSTITWKKTRIEHAFSLGSFRFETGFLFRTSISECPIYFRSMHARRDSGTKWEVTVWIMSRYLLRWVPCKWLNLGV